MLKNMTKPCVSTLSLSLSLSIGFLLFSSTSYALGPFAPSETQDPLCTPNEATCYVQMPDTFWEATTGGIHYSAGNVGIGTTIPASALTVVGNTTVIEGEDFLGPELITNGTFTGNADGWYLYDDANGSAFYDDNNVTVLYTGVESSTSIYADAGFVLESGKTYELSFDISNATDDVYFYFDSATDADCPGRCIPIDSTNYPDVSYGDGHHTFTFTSGYDGTDALTFDSYNQNPNTGWTIDNVSLREVVSGGGPAPFFTVSSSNTPFFSVTGNSLYLGNTTSNGVWDTVGRAKLNIFAGNSSVGRFYLNDGISVSFASMTGHDDGDGDAQQADGWGYSCFGPSTCSDPDDFVFTNPSSNSLNDIEFSGVYTGPSIPSGELLGFFVSITEEGDMDVFSWQETICSTNPMVRCISGNQGSGSYTINTTRAYDSLDTAIAVVGEEGSSIFTVRNNGSFSLGNHLEGGGESLSILNYNQNEGFLNINSQFKPSYGILDSTDSLGADGQVLSTDGGGNLLWIDGNTFLTDGIPNAIQSTLDLLSGSNILITDNGDGSVTIDANLSASPITLDTSNTLLSSAITAGSVPLSTDSIFFGVDAGYASLSSDKAISIGYNAGYGASGSRYNFIGDSSGSGANNVIGSNFFGTSSGLGADNASYSNFFGNGAGMNATDASYSNLFGFRAGTTFGANNIGSNNIIIGTNISLPNAAANSINFGGILFGANTYSTTTGDPSIAAVTNGRIGIATIPTTYTLEVGNNSVAGIVAHFVNSTGYCDINPTTTSLTCSSDISLKKDITDLPDTILSSLVDLRPVTYHWNSESDTDDTHVGFIAQEVQDIFPDLVSIDHNEKLSLNYTGLIPYAIKAIQEMNLNIIGIGDLTRENTWRDSLIEWFASAANGINDFFAEHINADRVKTKELCIEKSDGSDVCLTGDEIEHLMNSEPQEEEEPEVPQVPEEPQTPDEAPSGDTDGAATDVPAEEPTEEPAETLESTETPSETPDETVVL